MRGFDKLTGNTVTIDGVTLDETEFDHEETHDAGNILRRARGLEYISREYRMFFSGASEWDDGSGNWLPMEGSPVKFFKPGDKGFESTQPIFDCDAVLSALTLIGGKKGCRAARHRALLLRRGQFHRPARGVEFWCLPLPDVPPLDRIGAAGHHR